MDDSTPKCNISHEHRDMEKQHFLDLEKVEGPISESEEEEILSPDEVALEMLIVSLNWTLFSALISGSVWFNAPRLDSPVNIEVPTHESQPSSLRYTLSHGVFFVGSSLSLCVVLLIVLSKILMRQRTLTLKFPPFGPRHLPKHRVQHLRAILASMPPWLMKLLKSLQLIFPFIQFMITMAILSLVWFF
ncbi:uncharacterized protein F5147DRAFT_694134 [Suillus discolor]|uniref:Transmembrane protein n=1 Tax=Suillus discolor TaxID=1912936 RepID=A0A9P7F6E7_9AGAM|nr:uncharacterized protein F5147DRAFT_694134 [Suillus discolor]KAG2108646.1 hypothetical protein F5147DRAFT_694134 [Suillus discolor]